MNEHQFTFLWFCLKYLNMVWKSVMWPLGKLWLTFRCILVK